MRGEALVVFGSSPGLILDISSKGVWFVGKSFKLGAAAMM